MRKFFMTLFLLPVAASFAAGVPLIHSQWEGRRVAFLGDSITDPAQVEHSNNIYWCNLAEMLGIEPFVYAVNGHRMSDIPGQADRLEAALGQGIDAILVFVGTNDYNQGIPLGEWYTYSDSTTVEDGPVQVARRHRSLNYDPNTFKGRTNATISHLKTRFPDKQIIFITPIHRAYARFGDMNIQPPEDFANGSGVFVDEFVQAIKEAGNIWALPVIDLNSISGLYPVMKEQDRYFRNPETDRLHPNTAGQRRMAEALCYQLLAYPACFPKYCALSFDDGPNTTTTMQVLDILEENGIAASFFLIGRNITEETIPVMKSAVSLGCDLENHSFNHPYMSKLGREEMLGELNSTSDLIENALGQRPEYFRPPYIDYNELMHEVLDLTFISGLSFQDWNPEVSVQQRIDGILRRVGDGDIILLHDFTGNDKTVETLKVIIPELKRRGFTFVTVPELFEKVRGKVPDKHNGKIYSNAYR